MSIEKRLKHNRERIMKPRLRFIAGYSDYVVSDHGDVYSVKFNKTRKLLVGITVTGYASIYLCKDGIYTRKTVHRLVAQQFLPQWQGTCSVTHKDKNKLNNSVLNLQLCIWTQPQSE